MRSCDVDRLLPFGKFQPSFPQATVTQLRLLQAAAALNAPSGRFFSRYVSWTLERKGGYFKLEAGSTEQLAMSGGWRGNTYLNGLTWSKLPEDVLDRVLVWLPITSLARLRCVCKRWNSLLESPDFVALQARVSPQLPWILMFNCLSFRSFRAFDRSCNKWLNIPVFFLPYSVCNAVAASGGLICFKTKSALLVCNPILRCWKELPPMSCLRGVVALVTSSSSDWFKVVVAGAQTEDLERVTQIYDSRTNAWKMIKSQLPHGIALRSEPVCCKGHLYFTTASEPFMLLSLDIEQAVWKQMQAPVSDSLTFCLPVVCHDELHLVGGTGSNGITRSISIWELGKQWKEIDTMPDATCKKFMATCYYNYEQISCIGQEDLICLSCFTWPEALVHSVSRRCWNWLPRCQEIPLRSSCGFRWFSFKPNLRVLV